MDRIESIGNRSDDQPTPFPALADASTPATPVQTSSGPPRASSQRMRRPSIRISRLPSDPNLPTLRTPVNGSRPATLLHQLDTRNLAPDQHVDDSWEGNRRRSNSEPRPGRYSAPPVIASPRPPQCPVMAPLDEECALRTATAAETTAGPSSAELLQEPQPAAIQTPPRGLLRRASGVAFNALARKRGTTISGSSPTNSHQITEYDSQIVDLLDVIDPEVSTLSTLTNVQNSLFIPDLGGILNRMPTYTLTRPERVSEEETTSTDEDQDQGVELKQRPTLDQLRMYSSISSALPSDGVRYAVLPEDHTLDGWSQRDIEELNDHVRHMLHSRRSKFKRSMKGFGKYVRKPLGFLVTLYATLITLFGLAWVLFLIGWINVGGRQLYVINVIDNVLVALFAVMGDGLAPFRAVDTYHMAFIAHYTFKTWKIRNKRALPGLKDKNDLPGRSQADLEADLGEIDKEDTHEFSVLTPKQQQRLEHHQMKLSKSHTFYKPHETITHHAFPMRMLIAIIVLLDLHSCFQIALGTCTWSINYHVRPFALTTVILCCSITCNITGGVLIMIGDRRTRKKEVVERMFRQQLTSEAMKKMQKKKRKEKLQLAEELDTVPDPVHQQNSTLDPVHEHISTQDHVARAVFPAPIS
ncbi:hypothetical protein ASPZODRAFT_164511 [Penicilliopsis zonata CBS 506.65]|uniref:Integral membrane protein n=1 Tax=Penicilliopsis zonata CBS 506.65 TaxID=1073090 RepID=A0A1L9SPF4_9EURO|nr:hypothetical protein ASPZODRAFT_164511 [Penicilliopsis zonata CBS 506.65]OJJ48917.1 hypothetical protein ASPZODRAFT_164511 [Penicilliopsis zonata CBS 506.65]